MITYNEIMQVTVGDIGFVGSGRGHLKMTNHPVPLSIMEEEFNYLNNAIVSNNLKRGFEVATAFGVSALAAASAFKVTGGRLVTMDAYVEEAQNDAGTYQNFDRTVCKDMDGYKCANHLFAHFDVKEYVVPIIGWSPDDIPTAIETIFGDKKLDYVFIDSGHFPEQLRKEIEALIPYVDEKTKMFVHDIYSNMMDAETSSFIGDVLERKVEIVLPYPHGENLGELVPWI